MNTILLMFENESSVPIVINLFCYFFQEGEENPYAMQLKKAIWIPHLMRVSVSQNEYNGEKRQRITARTVVPLDFAAESKFLLEDISKMIASH